MPLRVWLWALPQSTRPRGDRLFPRRPTGRLPFNQNRRERTDRQLAAARNFLLSAALREEGGVLWLDADIAEARPGLLRDMAASGRDVLTPVVRVFDGSLYDCNVWAVGWGGGGIKQRE